MKTKYDEEFKMKIVGLYQSGRRQSDLMREFKIHKSQVQKWRKQYAEKVDLGVDGELSESQREIIALRERIRQLEKENEILKFATDWVKKKKI